MDNSFPRMVYKTGGPHEIHGGRFDYVIVDDAAALDAALSEGWVLTTGEALDLAKSAVPQGGATSGQSDDNSAPTRIELEAKATELGIKFDGRTGDKKLGELIAAKLKG